MKKERYFRYFNFQFDSKKYGIVENSVAYRQKKTYYIILLIYLHVVL